MCSESVWTRRRGCEVIHCARPVDNTAQLDPDTVAIKPSVPPRGPGQHNDAALLEAVRAHWREVVRRARPVDTTARQDPETAAVKPSVPQQRPGQQNDPSLHETVRAHWREVIHRARPVDNTARLDLDVDTIARADLGVDTTARADLGGDSTGRLDPDTAAVKPSVAPRRPGQQNDASQHETVRAHWREVIHRVRRVDNTARLDLGVETTVRADLGVETTAPVKPSAPPRRPRQQNHAALHEPLRARGRGGDVVRRARPVDSTARLRRGAVRPSVRRRGRDSRTMLHCRKL